MLFNPNFQSGPVWAGFRPFQAEKTGDSDPDKSGGIPNLLKRCAALGQFDFNINPGSEVELHQSINSLGSRLHDVEQALVGADFELFTGLFVNVGTTVDRELFDARRQRNGTPDQSAGALGGVSDVASGLIEHAMVERLQANADILGFNVRLPMRKSKKEQKQPNRPTLLRGSGGPDAAITW